MTYVSSGSADPECKFTTYYVCQFWINLCVEPYVYQYYFLIYFVNNHGQSSGPIEEKSGVKTKQI